MVGNSSEFDGLPPCLVTLFAPRPFSGGAGARGTTLVGYGGCFAKYGEQIALGRESPSPSPVGKFLLVRHLWRLGSLPPPTAAVTIGEYGARRVSQRSSELRSMAALAVGRRLHCVDCGMCDFPRKEDADVSHKFDASPPHSSWSRCGFSGSVARLGEAFALCFGVWSRTSARASLGRPSGRHGAYCMCVFRRCGVTENTGNFVAPVCLMKYVSMCPYTCCI